VSRQSKRNEASNIYGEHYNDRAEDIADRQLDGESIVATDDVFKVNGPRFGLDDHVIDENTGRTGSPQGGHGHKGDVAGGSDEVTNPRARHERESLRDKPPVHHRESITDSPEPLKR
jgi:hypothetical protein